MQPKNPLEINILIVVIAQEGNFIRASKRLGVTPPSLTRKVSTLEKSIGVKLFDRSTRNVQLTTAGRLFVQESSIAINHAERAWDLAKFQAQIEIGPYRIGYLFFADWPFSIKARGSFAESNRVSAGGFTGDSGSGTNRAALSARRPSVIN